MHIHDHTSCKADVFKRRPLTQIQMRQNERRQRINMKQQCVLKQTKQSVCLQCASWTRAISAPPCQAHEQNFSLTADQRAVFIYLFFFYLRSVLDQMKTAYLFGSRYESTVYLPAS